MGVQGVGLGMRGTRLLFMLTLFSLVARMSAFGLTSTPPLKISSSASRGSCQVQQQGRSVPMTMSEEAENPSRRSALLFLPALTLGAFAAPSRSIPQAHAAAPPAAQAGVGVLLSGTPTDAQTAVIKRAFQAFDEKRLVDAEKGFSEGIAVWEELKRPRDEMAELYKTRGNVLVE
jgi:hypothetical protein